MSRTLRVVAGVDVGGTHTRAVVADVDGRVRGRADGPGANRWSSAATAAEAVTTALTDALRAAEAPPPAATVVGTAGWGRQHELHRSVVAHLRGVGVDSPRVEVVPDVVVNHAAGTPARCGLVLAAGTGAIAARVEDGAIAARADGSGWLLGDEGSAVWMGLAAARAVLRALDGRGPGSSLVEPVLGALTPDDPDLATPTGREAARAALVTAGLELTPAAFGRLAPSVLAASDTADAVAVAIVDDAVQHLARSVHAVIGSDAPEELVLAGSLLLTADRVRTGVLDHLGAARPGLAVRLGRDGAAGAAALALRAATGRPVTEAAHRDLCGDTSPAG